MAEQRDEVEIASFDAGREQIVVRVTTFKGKKYLDLRKYWEADDGFAPSKKGCMVPAELVDDVLAAMEKGAAALKNGS